MTPELKAEIVKLVEDTVSRMFRNSPGGKLGPAEAKAYLALRYAEMKKGEPLEDREAWSFLQEHGIEEEKIVREKGEGALKDGDFTYLEGYNVPDKFETFRRYLTAARAAFDTRKYPNRSPDPRHFQPDMSYRIR
jgi:hypothetical protein